MRSTIFQVHYKMMSARWAGFHTASSVKLNHCILAKHYFIHEFFQVHEKPWIRAVKKKEKKKKKTFSTNRFVCMSVACLFEKNFPETSRELFAKIIIELGEPDWAHHSVRIRSTVWQNSLLYWSAFVEKNSLDQLFECAELSGTTLQHYLRVKSSWYKWLKVHFYFMCRWLSALEVIYESPLTSQEGDSLWLNTRQCHQQSTLKQRDTIIPYKKLGLLKYTLVYC